MCYEPCIICSYAAYLTSFHHIKNFLSHKVLFLRTHTFAQYQKYVSHHLQLPGVCWVCKWALNKVKKVTGPNATAEVKKKENVKSTDCGRPCRRSDDVIFAFTEHYIKVEIRLRRSWPLKICVPQICEGTPGRITRGTHYHWWCEDDLRQRWSLQVSHQPAFILFN